MSGDSGWLIVQNCYTCRVSTATLVREARLLAGLTQAELARRCATTQSAIARVERGASEPSFQRAQAIVRACGFDLNFSITPIDEDELGAHRRNLALSVDARVMRITAGARFIEAGRSALAVRRE